MNHADIAAVLAHEPIQHFRFRLCACEMRALVLEHAALESRVLGLLAMLDRAEGRIASQAVSLGVLHTVALEPLDKTGPVLDGTAGMAETWDAQHAHAYAAAVLRPT